MKQRMPSCIWPEWQLIRELGRGSYGCVYEAVRDDHGVSSSTAVKIISIPHSESEYDSLRSEGLSDKKIRAYFGEILDDFVNEIKLMESFKGTQNIVSVEDYKVVERKKGEFGWDIYIRMELLTPLVKVLEEKSLSEYEVVKLGIDICTALDLCSRRGIIHRDVKPENIFVNDFGDYKLGDFGVARQLDDVSSAMSQKGTYNYMAPEVARGEVYDERVDLYSLGIVMYRFVNGNRLPFIEDDHQQTDREARKDAVRRRLGGEMMPPPSNASRGVCGIILHECNPNPDKRFQTALEMRSELMKELGKFDEYEDDLDKTVSVRRAPAASKSGEPEVNRISRNKPKKNSPVAAIIAIVAVLSVIVGGIVFVMNNNNEDDSKDTKSEVAEEITDDESETSEEDKEVSKEDSSNDAENTSDKNEKAEEQPEDVSSDENEEPTKDAEKQPADTADAGMSREEFNAIIEEYDMKFTNSKQGIGSPANSYALLFIDDDDIPEILYSDSVSLCIASKTGEWMFTRSYDPNEYKFYYLPHEEMAMDEGPILDAVNYQYYSVDEGNHLREVDSATVYPDHYRVGANQDATKEMFEDFLHKYDKDGKSFIEVPLEYSKMYHSVKEAGDALLEEMMKEKGQ